MSASAGQRLPPSLPSLALTPSSHLSEIFEAINGLQHSHLESIVLNLDGGGYELEAITCSLRGGTIRCDVTLELEVLGAAEIASLKLPNLSVFTFKADIHLGSLSCAIGRSLFRRTILGMNWIVSI